MEGTLGLPLVFAPGCEKTNRILKRKLKNSGKTNWEVGLTLAGHFRSAVGVGNTHGACFLVRFFICCFQSCFMALLRMNPGEEGCPSTFRDHDLKRPWFTVAFPGTGCKVNKALDG